MTTNKPEYQSKYMRQYRKKYRRRIIQQLGGKCVKCGTSKNLEVHHVLEVERGSDKNGYDNFTYLMKSIKRKEPHILFCTICHQNTHIEYERKHYEDMLGGY